LEAVLKFKGGKEGGKMKVILRVIFFSLVFLFLLGLSGPAAYSKAPNFPDLSVNHWALKEIQALAQEGIISGYPDGTFRPENPVTRAEFAKLVLLASLHKEEPRFPAVMTFPDVPSRHWAFRYVEACAALGWMSGYPDGKFLPERTITKAEIVKVIVVARKLPPSVYDKSAFLDCREEDWFFPYVQTALSFNILRVPDPGFTEEVSKPFGAYHKEIIGYTFPLAFPQPERRPRFSFTG